jgi:aminopeptidase N/puromycin-sensitive aminopeptidase
MSILRKVILIACCIAPSWAGAQRLPGGVVPEHYSLTFTPDLAAATFSGEEDIQIKLQMPVNPAIVLNSAEIEIQKAIVTQGGNRQEAQISLDPAKEQATLAVTTPLGPGPASVHIQFTGILNDKMRGFYLAKTKLRRYAVSQFEATDARRAFPSFDEPALKAMFDVTLIVDRADTAISNGRIISDIPGPGAGKHTLKFSTTPRMSTYLVAMTVGDFQCNEGKAGGIPIRVCGTPDMKPLGEVALRYAGEILKYYNQYYGIQYPYGKLDIVGAPDFGAEAMENTAAIFYRDGLLFIDDKNSSLSSHAKVFVVLAHEMAHQWFGDLVTMKWWDNLWLNEGFASWMENKVTQDLHPEWNAIPDAVKETDDVLRLDALRNTHPIRAKAETPDEINELFDRISYEKGAAVTRMIESYIGPESFRRGVNAYLRKFQYSNATADDFWTAMAQASGRPVDKIMPTFVNQPGVPLVKVKAECITPRGQVVKTASGEGRQSRKTVQLYPKTEITLSQQRFFLDGTTDAGNQRWIIPVCIKTHQNKPSCHLLGERQQVVSVAGCSEWVFANANSVGYYRTQYDEDNWKKLSEAAVSGLTTAEWMALINDEIALVTAGKEKIGSLLNLISAVNADPKPEVVESYNGTLRFLDSYLITAADRENYHSWLRTVFSPMLARIGWTPVPGESDEIRTLRADFVIILGRLARDPETIKESTRLARQYLQDPNSIDPNLAESVLAVAANAGDMALLNEYLQAMQHMTAPEQYRNVTQSIAAFQGPELAERVLQEAISPGMRNQDAPFLIASELRNPQNHAYAWPWVKSHWADVEKKLSATSGSNIVFSTGSFCDAAGRDDVQRFFSEHKVPSSERALKQVAERINSCISYRERQQDNLAAWLGQHGEGGAVIGQQR